MKLGIIIGATRHGRVSDRQAKWYEKAAHEMDGIEPELVDLRDYPMPFFDEPMSPRYNQNRQIDPAAVPWLKKLDSFDAFIFVTPEYDQSIPGVLKNAIDYITWELNRKPVMIASHGSTAGARAQLMLKIILSEVKAVPLPSYPSLTLSGMSELIDENGELTEAGKANPRLYDQFLYDMLGELKWYSDALATARAKS